MFSFSVEIFAFLKDLFMLVVDFMLVADFKSFVDFMILLGLWYISFSRL